MSPWPILFINLDRDAERCARMQAEFARHGLQGERLPGVLWTALPQTEQDALYSPALNARGFHKPLVNGEKGCYASHLKAWRWLLASPHAAAVVLEDDVRLRPAFAEVLQALAEGSECWDMVKLIGRAEIGKREKAKSQTSLCDGHVLLRYRRVPSLTAGYVIHRRGAEKLLATRQPFGRPVDVDLRYWWESQGLVMRGVSPALIELDETSQDSSIGANIAERGLTTKLRKAWLRTRYSVANALAQER
jgi:glycosyl transferase family 25